MYFSPSAVFLCRRSWSTTLTGSLSTLGPMDEVVYPVPTLAERVATLVTSPGTVTNYMWDTPEALRSWGLSDIVLSADRAYSGGRVFSFMVNVLYSYPFLSMYQRLAPCGWSYWWIGVPRGRMSGRIVQREWWPYSLRHQFATVSNIIIRYPQWAAFSQKWP